jgi:hypothetical protein
MKIKRNVSTPILVALVLISLLVSFLTVATAGCEFYQFDHLGYTMPAFAGVFRSVYAVGWLLPIVATGISVWLLRKSECTAAQLAWSVSIVTVFLFAWSACSFIAIYTLHVSQYFL